MKWGPTRAQDQQAQCVISLKYHKIYPLNHLVTPVAGILPIFFLRGTRHNLFKNGSFVDDVYNI